MTRSVAIPSYLGALSGNLIAALLFSTAFYSDCLYPMLKADGAERVLVAETRPHG